MTHPFSRYRILEGVRDMLLTDELIEQLRPVFSRRHDVGHDFFSFSGRSIGFSPESRRVSRPDRFAGGLGTYFYNDARCTSGRLQRYPKRVGPPVLPFGAHPIRFKNNVFQPVLQAV
jgi:hypothetical protein